MEQQAFNAGIRNTSLNGITALSTTPIGWPASLEFGGDGGGSSGNQTHKRQLNTTELDLLAETLARLYGR